MQYKYDYSSTCIEYGEIVCKLLTYGSIDLAVKFMKRIKLNADVVRFISTELILPDEFIDQTLSFLEKDRVSAHQVLSINTIEKHIDEFYFMGNLVRCQTLNDSIMRKIMVKTKVHFPSDFNKMIPQYQVLTEDFMRDFKDKLDWDTISLCQTLGSTFIDEFADLLNWSIMSETQMLTIDQMQNYAPNLHWNGVSKFQVLTPEFIVKYKHMLNWDSLPQYQTITAEILSKCKSYANWNIVCMYTQLTCDEWENFIDYVRWTIISRYQTLTEDFIRKYSDKVDWEQIAYYQTLSDEFKLEFAEKLRPYIKIPEQENSDSDQENTQVTYTISVDVTNGYSDKSIVEVLEGGSAEFIITPNEGYTELDGVYSEGIYVENAELKSTVNSEYVDGVLKLFVSNINENREFSVVFSALTTYVVSATVSGGYVDTDTALNVVEGESVTLIFTPESAEVEFAKVYVNDVEMEGVEIENGVVTLTITPTEDTEVIVIFYSSEDIL